MQINIKHSNVEITEAIKNYAEEKLSHLGKYEKENTNLTINLDILRTEKHHKHGNHFKVSASLSLGSRKLHTEEVSEDMYGAIDATKDRLSDELAHNSDRDRSLMKRFARTVKDILKKGK